MAPSVVSPWPHGTCQMGTCCREPSGPVQVAVSSVSGWDELILLTAAHKEPCFRPVPPAMPAAPGL